MLFIPFAYASEGEQVLNQTHPQQEQVAATTPQVGENCEFPLATHNTDVHVKKVYGALTQQLLEQQVEQQKSTIAAYEKNTQQLTQEKEATLQENSTLRQEKAQLTQAQTALQQQYEQEKTQFAQERDAIKQYNENLVCAKMQLAQEQSVLQDQIEQCRGTITTLEQAKTQLSQEKETTLQENSTLRQENTKHTHKIENLNQKANELESSSQLHKSYWKTANQLLKDISQQATILVTHNNTLSITAYRYKIAAYVMAATSAGLALYSCWNGVQRTLNALGARIMALVTSDKTRKQRKKIEEELLTEEETH